MTRHALTGRHFIGGRWVPSAGGTFSATDPATGKALEPPFHEATAAEVDAALRAADDAFARTRDLPPSAWADILDAIARSILDLGDALLERAQAESGLPRPRLIAERARTTGQLGLFAAMVREGSWVDAVIDTADTARQPPKPDVRRMLRPIGPVAVFDASNFPLAFGPCGGDTASALAAGNPVAVKAHPMHPGTDELFAAAVHAVLESRGLPHGLFGLLQGSGPGASADLVKHPSTRAVSFTGSRRVGRILFDIAAGRPEPIPVYAEMGSLNPLVVLPGALAERSADIAAGLARSITLGAGQFCTKPGLALVLDRPESDRFVAELTRELAAMPAATLLGRRLLELFLEATSRFARAPGVKVHLQSRPSGFADMAPILVEVDAETFRREPCFGEEAFGPASVMVRCRDGDDLLSALEAAGGNLTATLHFGSGDDPAVVRRIAGSLEEHAGRVVFNGYPTGVEVCQAMVHGGPYPATSAPGTTSVGGLAIRRFARPVAYQDAPGHLLPPALQDSNPLGIERTVDGRRTREPRR